MGACAAIQNQDAPHWAIKNDTLKIVTVEAWRQTGKTSKHSSFSLDPGRILTVNRPGQKVAVLCARNFKIVLTPVNHIDGRLIIVRQVPREHVRDGFCFDYDFLTNNTNSLIVVNTTTAHGKTALVSLPPGEVLQGCGFSGWFQENPYTTEVETYTDRFTNARTVQIESTQKARRREETRFYAQPNFDWHVCNKSGHKIRVARFHDGKRVDSFVLRKNDFFGARGAHNEIELSCPSRQTVVFTPENDCGARVLCIQSIKSWKRSTEESATFEHFDYLAC